MSRLKIKTYLFAFVLSFQSVLISNAVFAQVDSDRILVQDILKDWQERHDATKSFRYECTIDESLKKSAVPGSTDVFGRVEKGMQLQDVILSQSMSFSYFDGFLAVRMRGEQWNDALCIKQPRIYEAVFDKVVNKNLLQTTTYPMCMLDRSPLPASDVTVLSDEAAIWLAFDPVAYLQRVGYDTKQIGIVNRKESCQGIECIELTVPVLGSKKALTGILYVDKAKGCVPIQFVMTRRGAIGYQIDITYASDPATKWVDSSWDIDETDVSGQPERSRGKVNNCVINSTLKKEEFTLEFPVGAHIVEKTKQGPRYFLQLENGILKAISEQEMGAISEKTPLSQAKVNTHEWFALTHS